MEDLQGERVREKNGFQSAGNPVYIYIIISTLTPSSSLSLSFWGPFRKKKTGRRQTREGLRLPLVEVCRCFIRFFPPRHQSPHFLKKAASVGKGCLLLFQAAASTSNLILISLSLPCNALFEWGSTDLLAPFFARLARSK